MTIGVGVVVCRRVDGWMGPTYEVVRRSLR